MRDRSFLQGKYVGVLIYGLLREDRPRADVTLPELIAVSGQAPPRYPRDSPAHRA
jgi:hypothetical protein